MKAFWLLSGFFFCTFEFIFWFAFSSWLNDKINPYLFFFVAYPLSVVLFGLFIKYAGHEFNKERNEHL